MSDAAYDVIRDLLFAHSGQEILPSRRWRIPTALSGLFRELGIDNLDQLVCLLSTGRDAELPQRVAEALLNNETYFFRDRNYFDNLSQRVLPALAVHRAATRELRIWSAGCSTGQEPLSLAMLLAGQPRWHGWRVSICATDLSSRAIKAARRATYSQFEIQRGISVTEMLTFFSEQKNRWTARGDLRRLIRFEQRNLLDTPPAGGPFDLILCRNVLLYFDRQTRSRAARRLHEAIAPDGWLMLGAGELLPEEDGLFCPEPGNHGLVRPRPGCGVSRLPAASAA
nr:CheR family methyltransferase [Qipengyuania thermophila]